MPGCQQKEENSKIAMVGCYTKLSAVLSAIQTFKNMQDATEVLKVHMLLFVSLFLFVSAHPHPGTLFHLQLLVVDMYPVSISFRRKGWRRGNGGLAWVGWAARRTANAVNTPMGCSTGPHQFFCCCCCCRCYNIFSANRLAYFTRKQSSCEIARTAVCVISPKIKIK